MSAFYAIYHGPHGLKKIAQRISAMARFAQSMLKSNGHEIVTQGVREDGSVLFDTVTVRAKDPKGYRKILSRAREKEILLRQNVPGSSEKESLLAFSIDETTTSRDLGVLLECFGISNSRYMESLTRPDTVAAANNDAIPPELARQTPFLTHPVFNQHHSETELLRYIHHLQSKDLSLVHSMIPLGSCTMKLNATTEMLPVSFYGFSKLHPFAPIKNAQGYMKLVARLSDSLTAITGMHDVSLQPNSGAQGEFAGLRVIKKSLDS